jgi:nucleoside-diphosphate-sugar epimerase
MAQSAEVDIVIVGCGDLGMTLAGLLTAEGLKVAGVRRSMTPLLEGVLACQADVTQPETMHSLQQLSPRVVIYSVAAAEQSDADYRAKYVEGLGNTVELWHDSPKLEHVFFVSSSRVYGQPEDRPLAETDAPIPADFGGRRLLEAESLLHSLPCPATALRLSGIYGPGRRRMLHLAQHPESWPQDNAWSNRIHRDDAAGFMAFLIQSRLQGKPVEPIYIVTDDLPTPQHTVLRWLATQMSISFSGEEPPPQGGKRLDNGLLRASGYRLRYPSFREGYAHELHQEMA